MLRLSLVCPLLPYTTLFRSQLFVAPRVLLELVQPDHVGLEVAGKIGQVVDAGAGDEPVTEQGGRVLLDPGQMRQDRSEEHTSELQSRGHLVCRLLLEKKKQN